MSTAKIAAGWGATLALAVGCAGGSAARTGDPTAGMRPVYRGEVYDPQRPDDPAAYRYERRLAHDGEVIVATHDTRSRDGAPVVRQTAWHDRALTLERFESVDHVTGEIGVLTRHEDGSITLRTDDGRRIRTRTETVEGPIVVGPTLFAFVRAHWQTLEAGRAVRVRFADVSRRRTYPFTLRLHRHDGDAVVVSFRADGVLVRLTVPTMYLTFDAADRTIRRYEGRVPPKVRRGRRWRPFDARVEYAHGES